MTAIPDQHVGHAMLIRINQTSGKPVYWQIIDQVKTAAVYGALRSSEALPSIRSLAQHLRINRNTVAKAYEELANMQLIESIPRKGCFVRQLNSSFSTELRKNI